MLRSIQVRDLAIVDDLSLDFGPGMTVLSGETGAGKSLIVDALNLAVGERARSDAIRTDADTAEVNAEFAPDERARAWLEQHDLAEDDDSCVLRRVVSRDGRSRAYVNTRPVPVSQLKALGDLLLDVHGQHAHQSLLKPAVQRSALDQFGGHDRELDAVRDAYSEMQAARAQIEALSPGDDADDRADYLRYQLGELEPWITGNEAPARLVEEHRRLAHADDIGEAFANSARALGEDGAEGHLVAALAALEGAERYAPSASEVKSLLLDAQALLSEADAALTRLIDANDTDPARLDELERALATLQDLARKHRTRIEELPDAYERLGAELERLSGSAEALAEARASLEQATQRYRKVAGRLSACRTRSARSFSEAIEHVLRELGMAETRVVFELTSREESDAASHGLDGVQLLVATNPGQPPAPIARIASGGELSRIALAIQNAASGRLGVPTLVFDEVDAGVGGAVAETLGRRMRSLGEQRQVLAVTHLPQVAAQAHAQVRVLKQAGPEGTRSAAQPLSGEDRIEEIARMLGGVELTERSVEHAREMLANADIPAPARRRRRTGSR